MHYRRDFLLCIVYTSMFVTLNKQCATFLVRQKMREKIDTLFPISTNIDILLDKGDGQCSNLFDVGTPIGH